MLSKLFAGADESIYSNVSKNLRLSTTKDTKKLEKLRKYKRLSLISCLSWLKRPYDS